MSSIFPKAIVRSPHTKKRGRKGKGEERERRKKKDSVLSQVNTPACSSHSTMHLPVHCSTPSVVCRDKQDIFSTFYTSKLSCFICGIFSSSSFELRFVENLGNYLFFWDRNVLKKRKEKNKKFTILLLLFFSFLLLCILHFIIYFDRNVFIKKIKRSK